MSRLDEDRLKIDEIDQQLTALFEERFQVVADVIQYKIDNNLPVLDSSREAVIEEKNMRRISDEKLRKYFLPFYREMLKQSRAYQEEALKEEQKNG